MRCAVDSSKVSSAEDVATYFPADQIDECCAECRETSCLIIFIAGLYRNLAWFSVWFVIISPVFICKILSILKNCEAACLSVLAAAVDA